MSNCEWHRIQSEFKLKTIGIGDCQNNIKNKIQRQDFPDEFD
jgi:hypothetical protein